MDLIPRRYPLSNNSREMQRAIDNARAIIRRRLNKKEYHTLRRIEREGLNPKSKVITKEKYKNTPSWVRFKRKILADKFRGSKVFIDRKDPDLYVIGGMSGSGKTSMVRGKYIKEKALYLNADDFKDRLSKRERSPIPRYPMVHAGLLHEDSSEIFDKALEKAKKAKMDVILDVTLGSPAKAKHYAKEFRAKGYDAHMFGVQVYPKQAIKNTTNRFLRNGRYVAPQLIKKKGNIINETLTTAAKANWYNSRVLIDNSFKKGQEKVIYKKGKV